MSEWYGDVNVTPFDAWSFVHLASGVVAASMKTTLPTFIMLHTLFELIENTEEVSDLMKQVSSVTSNTSGAASSQASQVMQPSSMYTLKMVKIGAPYVISQK